MFYIFLLRSAEKYCLMAGYQFFTRTAHSIYHVFHLGRSFPPEKMLVPCVWGIRVLVHQQSDKTFSPCPLHFLTLPFDYRLQLVFILKTMPPLRNIAAYLRDPK